MLFNSIDFLIFLPITVIIYYIIPKKIRYIWLLLSSYFFYMGWNAKYAILLLAVTIVTYISGILMNRIENFDQGRKGQDLRKICVIGTVILNLLILSYFKYLNYFINILNQIFGGGLGKQIPAIEIVLPVGISFYIFQALSYSIDVYRHNISAEKNFLRYALFVSFFPQLVAGPIERSSNLLGQIRMPKSFCYENLRRGSLLMLWGFFLKVVIADRAALIVNTVYADSITYCGIYIVIATFFFAIQIYCDFAGYSTIARGAALVMGFTLTDNFCAPYFSKSVKEFWRRWHISLTGWFRDYLYIPLGGNRKGKIRKGINLLCVFSLSGLWHGSSTAYVLWGILNGMYQVVGEYFQNFYESLARCSKLVNQWEKNRSIRNDRFSKHLLQQISTFLLINFTWLFFRAGDLPTALLLIKNMMCFNWTILFDGSLYSLGVPEEFFRVLIYATVLLFIVDYKKYKKIDVVEQFLAQSWYLRVIAEIFLLFFILLYGCYGELYDTTQFIYFQF